MMASTNKKRARSVCNNTSGANESDEYIEYVDKSSRKRQRILTANHEQESYRISVLPREIKNQIRDFLDDRSKRMMRASSTEWFNIINYDDFIIYFARPSTLPSLIQTFQRYSKPIGLTLEKTISFDHNFTKLAVLTNLTSLQVYANSPEDQLDPFIQLTALTALQQLTFAQVSFQPLVFNHFPNLTHIKISFAGDVIKLYDFQLNMIDVAKKLHNVTRLRSLEIFHCYCKGGEYDIELVSKMSNLSSLSILSDAMFPFTKLPNLECLIITSDTPDDFSLASTKLTFLQVQFSDQPDRLSHCQKIRFLTNLRTLNLRAWIKESELDFLTSLTNLESLKVDLYETLTGSCFQYVNSSKLTKVRCNYHIDVEHVSHLTSLQILSLLSTDNSMNTPVIFSNVTKLKAYVFETAIHCPNVKSLAVSYGDTNSPSARQVMASLSQLELLEVLNADAMAVQHMSGMTNLTRLVVEFVTNDNDNYEINYESLKYLTTLKELIFVKEQNSLSDLVGALPIQRSLTNLEALLLSHIPLDNDAVQVFEALPRLKGLSVDYEGDIFDESKLSNLTNLQRLTLRNLTKLTSWTDEIIPCKLTQLSYLYHYQDR